MIKIRQLQKEYDKRLGWLVPVRCESCGKEGKTSVGILQHCKNVVCVKCGLQNNE